MKIPMYQVDAFTSKVFGGNPAAVCPLNDWLEDEVLQNIAMENNLSETSFMIDRGTYWDIRWFTPTHEIDLAGHPTLASAWVIYNLLTSKGDSDEILFRTRAAGDLSITREGSRIVMDFPARPGKPESVTSRVIQALGLKPEALFRSRDWMAVFPDEESVRSYRPDYNALSQIANNRNGIIVTAPGSNGVDFVSRFFAPDLGINEDPVTGSAHCTLIPYWSGRLGKSDLRALQLSPRCGELFLEDRGDRVCIAGEAVLFLTGEIQI